MADNHKMVYAPDHEGPEVWRSDNNGPMPVEGYSQGTSQKHAVYPSYRALTEEGTQSESGRHGTSRKRPWLLVVSGLVAFIVGLGVGVGIGFAIEKTSNDSSSIPTTTNSTASPTSTPVTSGSTGIASFSCNTSLSDNTYTTEVNPMTFKQDCYQDYPGNDLAKETVYTFQACLERCALYNEHKTASEEDCQAVSYNANLTWYLPLLGGNCFLKQSRGAPWRSASGWPIDVMASAYVSDSSGD